MMRKKLINVIIYLYQHTTPPFRLQTAGVRPITLQRFGEKPDVFYILQLLSFDKNLYNFQRHTSDKNRTILPSSCRQLVRQQKTHTEQTRYGHTGCTAVEHCLQAIFKLCLP